MKGGIMNIFVNMTWTQLRRKRNLNKKAYIITFTHTLKDIFRPNISNSCFHFIFKSRKDVCGILLKHIYSILIQAVLCPWSNTFPTTTYTCTSYHAFPFADNYNGLKLHRHMQAAEIRSRCTKLVSISSTHHLYNALLRGLFSNMPLLNSRYTNPCDHVRMVQLNKHCYLLG